MVVSQRRKASFCLAASVSAARALMLWSSVAVRSWAVVVFIGFAPLSLPLSAVACDIHAERLLAKAGRQGAREGNHPPSQRSGEGERSAQAERGRLGIPLRRARAEPSAKVWLPRCVRIKAHRIYSGSRQGLFAVSYAGSAASSSA